jgi:hypothetical protein
MPDLPLPVAQAIDALDRLNRLARARAEYGDTWTPPVPAEAIYALKDRAIEVLLPSGAATCRRVVHRSTCRICNGSTWYRHPFGDDDDGEECQTCDAQGKIHLRFVETAIGAVRWHSPAGKGAGADLWRRLAAAGVPEASAGDWSPRQAGTRMEATEAAHLMTLAEDWLRPTWLVVPRVLDYDLNLGDIPGPCDTCGAEASPLRCHRRHGRVRWKGRGCLHHVLGETAGRLPREFDDGRIAAWMERHPAPKLVPVAPAPVRFVEPPLVTADGDDIPF